MSGEVVFAYQAPVYVHVDLALRRVTRVVCLDEAVEPRRDRDGRPVAIDRWGGRPRAVGGNWERDVRAAVEIAEDSDGCWPQ